VSNYLNGPYLGHIDILILIIITSAGWIFGRLLVETIGMKYKRGSIAYRRMNIAISLSSLFIIVCLMSSYYSFVLVGKTSYSKLDIAMYYAILFVLGISTRMTWFSALRGLKMNHDK
jgi:hypothetical protein